MTDELKSYIKTCLTEVIEDMTFDEWLTVSQFRNLYGYSRQTAEDFFKSHELVRLGILIKISIAAKQGGWRMNRRKFEKWASNNAAMALPTTFAKNCRSPRCVI